MSETYGQVNLYKDVTYEEGGCSSLKQFANYCNGRNGGDKNGKGGNKL